MKTQFLTLIDKAETLPGAVIALMARVALAGIFFKSGLTKVEIGEDGFAFASSVQYLFEEEYQIPLLPWDVAAFLAAANELILPVLLVIGLATRFSALALLGMTAVIQVFVYPQAWDTHLIWATALVYLISRGAGAWSVDRVVRARCTMLDD